MTERKKDAGSTFDMPFSEALERLIQTNPAELRDHLEKIRKEREDVDKYVKEREESIRKGARRAPKKFRL